MVIGIVQRKGNMGVKDCIQINNQQNSTDLKYKCFNNFNKIWFSFRHETEEPRLKR